MQEPSSPPRYTNFQVILFVIALCFICSATLAITAYSLEGAQNRAKEFDQSKQMLIAAKVLNHAGYFEILNPHGEIQLARFDANKQLLIPDAHPSRATDEQINLIAKLRIRPLLTDNKGNLFTLDEKGIDLAQYLAENKKSGYAHLSAKLFYAILPNQEKLSEITDEALKNHITLASVFIIPVSGFGLWAPIYGFIAVGPNGDDVIGTTWYEHGETPGLGANITEPWWQKQFFGKHLFQEAVGGRIDFFTADLGIMVVKGKVRDVFGDSPKAKSAVDGMSGATLTGDGVTLAYRNSLAPYRPFLIKLHESTNGKNSS